MTKTILSKKTRLNRGKGSPGRGAGAPRTCRRLRDTLSARQTTARAIGPVGGPLLVPPPQSGGGSPMLNLRRRQFITLLGGAAAAWPCVAAGQSAKKRPVVGILGQGTPAQRKGVRWIQSFLAGMRELGYVEGRDFD